MVFLVYSRSLRYADLTTVTFGWVVLLELGVMVWERSRGVVFGTDKLVALAALVALQAYLMLSPGVA